MNLLRLLTQLTVLTLALVGALPAQAQICNGQAPYTRPNSRYTNHGDGTATDLKTGLMWKRCHEGQSWNGTACVVGDAAYAHTWQSALRRAARVNSGLEGQALGYTTWRLPNAKELLSLVEENCMGPAINPTWFSTTPASVRFWTSTTAPTNGSLAAVVDFNEGTFLFDFKYAGAGHVRLVRAAW